MVDARNTLVRNPKVGEGCFKEKALQDGLETLKNALDRYWAAHTEVRDELILEVWKEVGSENEAAVEPVLAEDSDMYNDWPFIGEAMSTFGELRVLLRIHRRKKAAVD